MVLIKDGEESRGAVKGRLLTGKSAVAIMKWASGPGPAERREAEEQHP